MENQISIGLSQEARGDLERHADCRAVPLEREPGLPVGLAEWRRLRHAVETLPEQRVSRGIELGPFGHA